MTQSSAPPAAERASIPAGRLSVFDRLLRAILPELADRNPFFDAVRGLAVLAVVVRHAWGLSGSARLHLGRLDVTPLLVSGSMGVDMFFVLSGALLGRRFLTDAGSRVPIKAYFKSRWLRIWPPYAVVLVLTVWLATPAFIPPDRVWSVGGLKIFLAHLFMAQTLFLFSYGAYMVQSPFWTLTHEETFYAVLPLGARLFRGSRWVWALGASLLVSVAWRLLSRQRLDFLGRIYLAGSFLPYSIEDARRFLSQQFPTFIFHFAVGISVAALIRKSESPSTPLGAVLARPRTARLCLATGAAWALISSYVVGSELLASGLITEPRPMYGFGLGRNFLYLAEPFLTPVGFGMLLLGGALLPVARQARLSPAILRFLGVISFSIYLIHMPLLFKANAISGLSANPLRRFVELLGLAVPGIILLSLLYFAILESRAMRWSRRAQRARPGADAAVLSASVASQDASAPVSRVG